MEEITDQNIKTIPLEKKESKEQKCVRFPWRDYSKTTVQTFSLFLNLPSFSDTYFLLATLVKFAFFFFFPSKCL